MNAGARPWRIASSGVTLAVRLTPKGGRDAIEGVDRLADGTVVLKVRVRAAPTGGEANVALTRLIAKMIGVPARDVTVMAGATARIKRLAIAGDGPSLLAALEKTIAAG